MKKIVTFLIFLLIIGFLGYRYFIYYDKDEACFIRLKPPLFELSSINIKEGIKILKYAVPEEYKRLCAHIDTIDPRASCGGFQGGCFYTSEALAREIDIGTATDEFVGWTAAVIAHETCHAIQYQTGGEKALDEGECYAIGDKVMKAVIDY